MWFVLTFRPVQPPQIGVSDREPLPIYHGAMLSKTQTTSKPLLRAIPADSHTTPSTSRMRMP